MEQLKAFWTLGCIPVYDGVCPKAQGISSEGVMLVTFPEFPAGLTDRYRSEGEEISKMLMQLTQSPTRNDLKELTGMAEHLVKRTSPDYVWDLWFSICSFTHRFYRGAVLVISLSDGGQPTVYDRPNKLHVRNLPFDMTDAELEQMFSEYGKVQSAKVVEHHYGGSRGFASVEMENEEDASAAIKSLDGKHLYGSRYLLSVAQVDFAGRSPVGGRRAYYGRSDS